MKISVVRDILEANERIADQNRDLFNEHGLLVLNLMSSPGAGKTTLLEKTIEALKDDLKMGIIEGDIQSSGRGADCRQGNSRRSNKHRWCLPPGREYDQGYFWRIKL